MDVEEEILDNYVESYLLSSKLCRYLEINYRGIFLTNTDIYAFAVKLNDSQKYSCLRLRLFLPLQ